MSTSLTYNPQTDPVTKGLVTIGALIVLFIGTRIPLPGLSAEFLQRIPIGPALGRLSIFALGVTPIVFARVIVEFFRLIFPPLARSMAAPDKALATARLTRGLALLLAAIQAYGVALALESAPGLAVDVGLSFRIGIVITAIGATAVLIVLADFVMRRGFGDGLLILLAVPAVTRAPASFALWIELGRTGAIPSWLPIAGAMLALVAVGLLVAASLIRGGASNAQARANLAKAELDIWPPLLATSILGPLGVAAILFMHALGFPPPPAAPIVHMLVLAALIALFAALRARAAAVNPANLQPVALAEIATCVGAALFAYTFQISSDAAGFWIVCVVAAVLSCFSKSVRL